MNKTSKSNEQYIQFYFKIKNIEGKNNIAVHCPFHHDKRKSAAVNFEKKVFNCFKCGGLNFQQLRNKLTKNERIALENEKLYIKTPNLGIDFKKRGIQYLKDRGLDPENLPIWAEGNSIYRIDNKPNPFYGFLILESLDGYFSGRNLITEDELEPDVWKVRPKYMNEPMEKGLFWIARNEENYKDKIIFLVEGVFDGLSLHELDMGIGNIAALGGAEFAKANSDNLSYSFRGKTVLILLDNDPAGFKGSKKIADKLKEFDVDYHILELPLTLGKDVNEALVKDKSKLKSWLANILDVFDPDDKKYTQRLFRGHFPPLNILPTGIVDLDKKLTGGFKEGGHIISGVTGIGKTSLVFDLSTNAVINYNKRVIINSCEISKRQSWARIASQFSNYTWEELEEEPNLLEEDKYKIISEISSNIIVVNGWPLKRILQESKNYDVIIIDYLQRVREAYGSDENATRHLINNYTSKMTDLGALQAKICIMISSLGRASYDKPDDYGLKESGSLEYMGTSVSRISAIGDPSNGTFMWRIQKNTRGETGMVRLRGVDLGHSLFRNAKTERVDT